MLEVLQPPSCHRGDSLKGKGEHTEGGGTKRWKEHGVDDATGLLNNQLWVSLPWNFCEIIDVPYGLIQMGWSLLLLLVKGPVKPLFWLLGVGRGYGKLFHALEKKRRGEPGSLKPFS